MARLSVIIPAYNEEKDIEATIKSLKEQSLIPNEIIIVDDGSTDRTIEIAKAYKVKILSQNHKGPGVARNQGAKNAKGEILIFVDADMTFDKDYIKNLVKPIEKSKEIIGTTHDSEIVLNTNNIWSACWGKIRVSPENANDVKIFRAIRKSKFMELGGFDPKYGYADDQTFWFKYKINPTVAENTICYHKNPESLKAVYKQSVWIGASIDNVLTNMFLLRYLSPLFLIILSPLVIPLLAVRKSFKQDLLNELHLMLIFIFFRYFGTINGIFRNVYLKRNYR